MTDHIREQMSALLDGELPRGEVDLLVRRMARDAELKRAFGNYVLAGESLRAPGGVMAGKGFAARVSAAIDAEESASPVAEQPAPSSAPSRWRRPLAATAVRPAPRWRPSCWSARIPATASSSPSDRVLPLQYQ